MKECLHCGERVKNYAAFCPSCASPDPAGDGTGITAGAEIKPIRLVCADCTKMVILDIPEYEEVDVLDREGLRCPYCGGTITEPVPAGTCIPYFIAGIGAFPR